jgi:hypothetical protein
VIRECMNEPGLEFVWVGDDAVDPLEQAQTLQILVGAGIKTREEARADLGLAPAGGKGPAADDNAAKALRKFNPHHSRPTGQFTSADDPDAQPAETPRVELVADKPHESSGDRAPSKTPAGYKLSPKIQRGMERRSWTAEQIDKAAKSGNRVDAINKENGSPATRYVNPDTGQSVVIDNATNEVIHVGKDSFDYGPESGDVPGAVMRPAPLSGSSSSGASPPPTVLQETPGNSLVEPAATVEPITPIEPIGPILPIEPLP